jgi:hypothetical protein
MMNIDDSRFVLPPLTTDQLQTILAALSLYAQNLADPTEAAKATALADEILEASMRRTASSASGACLIGEHKDLRRRRDCWVSWRLFRAGGRFSRKA